MNNKRILLYYKYVSLPSPHDVRAWQHELCSSLELRGRIIIATEGINGTVCGTPEATNAYITAMQAFEPFADIDFKDSIVNGAYEYFPKLQVVVRPEIVHLGIDPASLTHEQGGKHLTPEQAHALMTEAPEDLVILDGRNYYEARVGTFKNSITPHVNHFRDFPTYIDQNLDLFKDKQVLMHCTGGIRCERASAYLKSKNIAKEVYQIEGGIHRYVEKYPDGFFRGKNYVFDARITVPVNDDIIGSCDLCATTCDDYTNCRNAQCNKQFIGCPSCLESFHNCCSKKCLELVENKSVNERPYRPKVDARI